MNALLKRNIKLFERAVAEQDIKNIMKFEQSILSLRHTVKNEDIENNQTLKNIFTAVGLIAKAAAPETVKAVEKVAEIANNVADENNVKNILEKAVNKSIDKKIELTEEEKTAILAEALNKKIANT